MFIKLQEKQNLLLKAVEIPLLAVDTQPISKPFGIQPFATILTKAEKWEIEKKI